MPQRMIKVFYYLINCRDILTQKQLETHGCILNIVATDVLVLKHQVISIHSADYIFIVLDLFHGKNITLLWTALGNWEKKMTWLFKG